MILQDTASLCSGARLDLVRVGIGTTLMTGIYPDAHRSLGQALASKVAKRCWPKLSMRRHGL